MKAGYICEVCHTDTMDITVRERSLTESILDYMDYIGRMCWNHHIQNHTSCPAAGLDIKVPITKKGIGFEGPPLSPEEQQDLRNKLNEK